MLTTITTINHNIINHSICYMLCCYVCASHIPPTTCFAVADPAEFIAIKPTANNSSTHNHSIITIISICMYMCLFKWVSTCANAVL